MNVPDCRDDVCLTCSDSAASVAILHLLDNRFAIVRTAAGSAEQVSVALVTAQVGDTILVHAGEAIAVVGTDSR